MAERARRSGKANISSHKWAAREASRLSQHQSALQYLEESRAALVKIKGSFGPEKKHMATIVAV